MFGYTENTFLRNELIQSKTLSLGRKLTIKGFITKIAAPFPKKVNDFYLKSFSQSISFL
jgi:hypothetical protein